MSCGTTLLQAAGKLALLHFSYTIVFCGRVMHNLAYELHYIDISSDNIKLFNCFYFTFAFHIVKLFCMMFSSYLLPSSVKLKFGT